MKLIKWIKDGYSGAMKSVIKGHKIAFSKSFWFMAFMFPILYIELFIVTFVVGLVISWLFGISPDFNTNTIESWDIER